MISSNCYDILMKQNWNENTAKQELFRKEPLPAIYTTPEKVLGTLQKISQVAKKIFIVLLFPIYLSKKCYQFVHGLMGNYLIPASLKNRNNVLRFVDSWNLSTFTMTSIPVTLGLLSTIAQIRFPDTNWKGVEAIFKMLGKRDIEQGKKWQYQRFTVAADEQKIDAVFIGRKKQVAGSLWFSKKEEAPPLPRRVIVYCGSQDELAEGKIHDEELLKLAEKTHSDVVVWNPPGIGATPGRLSLDSMVKACGAMLQFVEDAKGLGAKEVICSGHSMGAAVLLAAAEKHEAQPGVGRVFFLRSAFSTMQEAMATSISRVSGAAVRLLGWNMNNVETLKKIKDPVIMLHMAAVDGYEPMTDSVKLIPDAVLEEPEATLAKAVLDQGVKNPLQKVVGVPRWHDEPLTPEHIDALSKDIEASFKVGA